MSDSRLYSVYLGDSRYVGRLIVGKNIVAKHIILKASGRLAADAGVRPALRVVALQGAALLTRRAVRFWVEKLRAQDVKCWIVRGSDESLPAL